MLICFQKVNFITHFFLRILQQNSKLVTLGNLGIPGNTYLNWYCSINLKKGKKSTSHFSKDIAKILQTCYFGYFGHARLHIAKVILLTCRKLCLKKTVYLHAKNQLILQFFLFICMLQMHFIIHFFPEILNFKESCN